MKSKPKNQDAPYPVQMMPLNKIRTNLVNPRTIEDHKFNQLVESIKTDGFMLAIRFLVIDENNVVLGGNQRLHACIKAGLKEVPVVRAEILTEQQIKEFIIQDNNYFGQWDTDMLHTMYDQHELIDIGLDIVDFQDVPLEVLGGEDLEKDSLDLKDKKKTYDENDIKQIVTYFTEEVYEQVIDSINRIKEKNKYEDNSEVLLQLITYWKRNYEYISSRESAN